MQTVSNKPNRRSSQQINGAAVYPRGAVSQYTMAEVDASFPDFSVPALCIAIVSDCSTKSPPRGRSTTGKQDHAQVHRRNEGAMVPVIRCAVSPQQHSSLRRIDAVGNIACDTSEES